MLQHVHHGAPDMFLPGKHDQSIANRDCLIVDGIGETDTVTRDDFELAFSVDSDQRGERRESHLEYLADRERRHGLRGHLELPLILRSRRTGAELSSIGAVGGEAARCAVTLRSRQAAHHRPRQGEERRRAACARFR
jgi:hypothetical protein